MLVVEKTMFSGLMAISYSGFYNFLALSNITSGWLVNCASTGSCTESCVIYCFH